MKKRFVFFVVMIVVLIAIPSECGSDMRNLSARQFIRALLWE